MNDNLDDVLSGYQNFTLNHDGTISSHKKNNGKQRCKTNAYAQINLRKSAQNKHRRDGIIENDKKKKRKSNLQ